MIKPHDMLIMRLPCLPAFRQDRAKAVEILVKDLKVFASFNEDLFKEITQLLTLDNFRFLLWNCCSYYGIVVNSYGMP